MSRRPGYLAGGQALGRRPGEMLLHYAHDHAQRVAGGNLVRSKEGGHGSRDAGWSGVNGEAGKAVNTKGPPAGVQRARVIFLTREQIAARRVWLIEG